MTTGQLTNQTRAAEPTDRPKPATAPMTRTIKMSASGEPLVEATITWSPSDHDRTLIQLDGELCTRAVVRVGDLVEDVARSATSPVSIDLSGVTFVDGLGISLLARTRRQLAERGIEFEIVSSSSAVRRVVDLVACEPYRSERGCH
jgi:anti-anti-sigma factor